MTDNRIIAENIKIRNFLMMIGLSLIFTKPQTAHVCRFIAAMTQKGFSGKMVDIIELLIDTKHRTCIGKFLSSKSWHENLLLRKLQRYVIKTIWSISSTTGLPVYLIIDDTISEKTKPSSKAIKPTEKAKFHYSHLKGKQVYGHQIVVALLQCGKIKLPLAILLYDKENQSKIQMAMNIISMMPTPPNKGYVLADSWYSSKDIINASKRAGYNYIGALKVNRVIYPKEHRINWQIQQYAKTLKEEDFHLVTVKNSDYYVYRYEGKLNGIKGNVVVIISWPKDALFNANALKAFVSTDTCLDDIIVLQHYCSRWPIEVFIRQTKMVLGLNKYQVRQEIAIKRFWVLCMLSYIYISSQSVEKKFSFVDGLRIERNNVRKSMFRWAYEQGRKDVSFEDVALVLKIA